MISVDTYYKRAFVAARAHGQYVGGGKYVNQSGEVVRVRLFEDWSDDPSRGFLVHEGKKAA